MAVSARTHAMVEADGAHLCGQVDGAQAFEALGDGAARLVGAQLAALGRLLEVEGRGGGEQRPRGEGARAAPSGPRGDDGEPGRYLIVSIN